MMKLRTKERLKIFGQMVAIGYVVALIILVITQNLSLENTLIALFVDFAVVWMIFLFLGDYR